MGGKISAPIGTTRADPTGPQTGVKAGPDGRPETNPPVNRLEADPLRRPLGWGKLDLLGRMGHFVVLRPRGCRSLPTHRCRTGEWPAV
jgi:hypothetical protein